MSYLKTKFSIFTVLKFIYLAALVTICLYPFLHVLAISLSSLPNVIRNKVNLIPKGFTLIAYEYVFKNPRIYRSYFNTIELVVLGTLISLTITAMGAFALSQKRMLWHSFFTWMLIIPMFFDGGLIPTYLTVRGYGLLDSIWAIILPYTVNIMNLIILRTFFSSLPYELQEAAKMDGLSDIGIFFRIIIPLSKAGLAAIGLFYAVAYWNTYVAPMIYLTSDKKFPLQLVLRQMLILDENFAGDVSSMGSAVADTALKYATIIVALIPIVAVYPFLQKYFVKGVMLGSIKG